ncbi:beta-ketoacyl reductase, partial [Actinomadura sediminis]
LVLTGRRGPDAPGDAELAAGLRGLGADVRVEACDVADRAAIADLLAGIGGPPLTAIFHAAGALDDALVTELTPGRLEAPFRPKVDGSVHLHELAPPGLSAFVLFTSAVGVFGQAGQGGYAAANAFQDALAAARRAAGLPGLALAWGTWAGAAGMASRLAGAAVRRTAASGLVPLDAAENLALLDRALTVDRPVVVPVRLDLPRIRARAAEGEIPPAFTVLAGGGPRRPAAPRTGDDAARLAALPAPEREALLLEQVRAHVAAVLGHDGPAAVDPARGLVDLGLDSLSAIELRNRIGFATGLRLPATLVFDHPTAAAIAAHLAAALSGPPAADTVESEIARLEEAFAGLAADDRRRRGLAARLRALAARWEDPGEPDDAPDSLGTATAAELFDILDEELAPQDD